MIEIINLASGSRGNCTLVKSKDSCILIDAGISPSEIKKRLPVSTENISAVFVTHEHIDHVRGLAGFCKEFDVPAFIHNKVVCALGERAELPPELIAEFGDFPFEFRDLSVTSFRIPHDTVYPVGFTFSDGEFTSGVVTDLGRVTDGVINNLSPCDTLLLESNHDVHMLLAGKYPPHLKRRIMSNLGHLSNEDCADLIVRLAGKKLRRVMLGHLSENNNTPRLAYTTTEKLLAINGYTVNGDVFLSTASPDSITYMKTR